MDMRKFYDITHREPFERSEDFQPTLERAVKRRVAFTKHVDATLDAKTTGTRPGVKDYIETAGEVKTKPTQHSVRELRAIGIQPDVLLCRTDRYLPKEIKSKIEDFYKQVETVDILVG